MALHCRAGKPDASVSPPRRRKRGAGPTNGRNQSRGKHRRRRRHLGEPDHRPGCEGVPRSGTVRQHPRVPRLEFDRWHRHRGDARPDGRARRRHRNPVHRFGPHRRTGPRRCRRIPGTVPRGGGADVTGAPDPERSTNPPTRRTPVLLDGARHAPREPSAHHRPAALPGLFGLRRARHPGGHQRRSARAACAPGCNTPSCSKTC